MKHLFSFALLCSALAARAQAPGIDYSFQAVPPDGVVNKVLVQPDGKILVGGAFYEYAGTERQGLVRLNADGTLDTGWNPGAYGLNGTISDMELMPDGRIMIGGTLLSYNGVSCGNLARLNADGTLDLSFLVPFGAINAAVLQLELHPDEKVVAAGDFQHCYGVGQPHIARFNTNGSLDTTFHIGIGFYATVRGLKALPDHRLMAVGDFNMFDQTTCMYMARLQAEGPYDTTYNANPGLNGTLAQGRAVDVQADGKVLVAGTFTHHAGAPANGLIRLHPDGTRDTSFTSPFSPWAYVNTVEVLPDGKILAGGEFTNGFYWPAVPAPARFVRLHPDGSWDSSFPLGTGFSEGTGEVAFIKDVALQADGKLLVGGMFGDCDGETQYQNLIRLLPEFSTGLADVATGRGLQVGYDPSSEEVVLTLPHDPPNATVALYTSAGQLLHAEQVNATAARQVRLHAQLPAGLYLVRVGQGREALVGKVLVGPY